MTRTESLDSLIATVKTYADLPDNWDSYDGLPACEKAITFTVGLLEQLRTRDAIPLPRVLPISSGVYVDFSDDYYVEVDEDGAASFGLVDEGGLVDSDGIFSVTHAIAALTEMWPPDPDRFRKPQDANSGMAAVMGRWPGDETDEEIKEALEPASESLGQRILTRLKRFTEALR